MDELEDYLMSMTGERAVNGHHPRSAISGPLPVLVPSRGPSSPWLADGPLPPPGGLRGEAPVPSRRRLQWPSWARPDGDTVIRLASWLAVLAVSGIAAVISYTHIYALALATHEFGTDARLLPLSVDGLILASSLTLLHAARRDLAAPVMAYLMLALGVGATVAANVEFGLPWGWKASCVAAWPAVAFIGSVEVALRMTRSRGRQPGDRLHWRPWRRVKAVTPEAVTPVMTEPPQAVTAPLAAPSPGPLGALVKAAPAPSRKAPVTVVTPSRKKAPPSSRAAPTGPSAGERIDAAVKRTPSLATSANQALAEAAGVSVTSVERWRKRQRDGEN